MLARVLAVIVCRCVRLFGIRRYCVKTAKRRITQTTPRDSTATLVFWRQQSLVGDPHFPWNLCSKWPTPFRTHRFRPIFAHSALTVRAGEKCSISTNRKSTTRFKRAIDEPCTLPLSPPKGGTKRDFAVFASKIQRLSKEVCYKVYLCENSQRQICSYIIPLFNGL